MALGRFYFTGTNLDSSSDPDDTTLFAAPGAGQTAYVQWVLITVTTPQASSVITLENGVGGDALIRVNTTSSDDPTHYVDFRGGKGSDGLQLSANTALNAEVSGATGVVAEISGEVVVKG